MSTTKAHPHAELMKLYAEDATETDKPWERWEFRMGASGPWVPQVNQPRWFPDFEYRRKSTLFQGYIMEQWESIREQGFDCEFSDSPDFSNKVISKLTALKITDSHPFVSGSDNPYQYCRPRRAKGIKQPWFGGECPVTPGAWIVVYTRNGDVRMVKATPDKSVWKHLGTDSDIIAFIEL